MTAETVEQQIRELEKLKGQTRWWRRGAGAALALTAVVCIGTIANSVHGLMNEGPTQQAFVTELSSGLQRNVVPSIENLAGQTLTEMKPEVEAEFRKLNDRVPEVAEVSLEQMELLQTNLPKRAEGVLMSSFGEMMSRKETTLREMFPEMTEEKVSLAATNLKDMAMERAGGLSDRLFSRHVTALTGIVGHMDRIQIAEASTIAEGEEADWEMALAVLDVVREDLRELEPHRQKAQVAEAAAIIPSTNSAREVKEAKR